MPNVYFMDGTGPSYMYSSVDNGFGTQSFCLASSQGQIGFCVDEFPLGTTDFSSGGVGRCTVGKYTTKKGISAKTAGFTTETKSKIHFNAAVVSAP